MWIVELVRIGNNINVSIFSLYLVLSQEVQMQELLQIFAYLKKHLNSEMVFDPSEPDIDMTPFNVKTTFTGFTPRLVKNSRTFYRPTCFSHLAMVSKYVVSWTLIILESLLITYRGPASLSC